MSVYKDALLRLLICPETSGYQKMIITQAFDMASRQEFIEEMANALVLKWWNLYNNKESVNSDAYKALVALIKEVLIENCDVSERII